MTRAQMRAPAGVAFSRTLSYGIVTDTGRGTLKFIDAERTYYHLTGGNGSPASACQVAVAADVYFSAPGPILLDEGAAIAFVADADLPCVSAVDLNSGDVIWVASLPSPAYALLIPPGYNMLLVGTADGVLAIDPGLTFVDTLLETTPAYGAVKGLAITHDGAVLVTLQDMHTVVYLRIPTTTSDVETITVFAGTSGQRGFSGDGGASSRATTAACRVIARTMRQSLPAELLVACCRSRLCRPSVQAARHHRRQ